MVATSYKTCRSGSACRFWSVEARSKTFQEIGPLCWSWWKAFLGADSWHALGSISILHLWTSLFLSPLWKKMTTSSRDSPTPSGYQDRCVKVVFRKFTLDILLWGLLWNVSSQREWTLRWCCKTQRWPAAEKCTFLQACPTPSHRPFEFDILTTMEYLVLVAKPSKDWTPICAKNEKTTSDTCFLAH